MMVCVLQEDATSLLMYTIKAQTLHIVVVASLLGKFRQHITIDERRSAQECAACCECLFSHPMCLLKVFCDRMILLEEAHKCPLARSLATF